MFEYVEKIKNADLKNYSTFKIGGKGIILFPKSICELKKVIADCKKNGLDYFILGNGSNVLFPDYDLKITLISLKNFKKIKKNGDFLQVDAGVNMFFLNKYCLDNCLSGLEWSYGIPASFGGLVHMNGGAYGSCIGDFIKKVKVLKNGKVMWIDKDSLNFSYRASNIKGIILGAKIHLKSEDKMKIEEKQRYFFECRKSTQPLEYPSAGSIFKRKGEIIHAKIIDELNLKGTRVGGAEISQKHAGFIINKDSAKAIDVLALISYIKRKTNLNLEEEIVVLR